MAKQFHAGISAALGAALQLLGEGFSPLQAADQILERRLVTDFIDAAEAVASAGQARQVARQIERDILSHELGTYALPVDPGIRLGFVRLDARVVFTEPGTGRQRDETIRVTLGRHQTRDDIEIRANQFLDFLARSYGWPGGAPPFSVEITAAFRGE